MPSFHSSSSSLREPGVEPGDLDRLAEGAALAGALAGDDGRDPGFAQRVCRGDRGGREAVLGGEHVVAAELARDRPDRTRLAAPGASTATVVTSASPIISAAAVEAVRPGLRIAFERARRPATPPIRVAGQPRTSASGRAMLGRDHRDAEEEPEHADAEQEQAGAGRQRPRRRRRRRRARARPRRRRARPPARSARGGTAEAPTPPGRRRSAGRASRAAAGQRLASSVTTVPTTSETITVRVAKTSPVCGRSTPNGLEQRLEPLREPEPDEEPDRRGERARSRAPRGSPPDAPAARSRPSSRSVANSRARWAIVIESVFAITNAPTKSAMPPKASRK